MTETKSPRNDFVPVLSRDYPYPDPLSRDWSPYPEIY